MTTKEREALYNDAVRQWGLEAQRWMLVEEMGELLQALNKLNRATQHTKADRIQELRFELADVAIMVEQVWTMLFDSLDDLRRVKEIKLERLARRLGGAQ